MCCPWSKENENTIKTIEEVNGVFSDCSVNGVNTISGSIVIDQPVIVKRRVWKTENGEYMELERKTSRVCKATESIVETETVAEVLTPVLFAKAEHLDQFDNSLLYEQCFEDSLEVTKWETATIQDSHNKTRRTVEVHQSCSSPEPDPACPSSPTSSTSEETAATAPADDSTTPPSLSSATNTSPSTPISQQQQISDKLESSTTNSNLLLEDEGLGRSSQDGQDVQEEVEEEEHDYEDIYTVRRRDSGSHSRSGSLSSAGSNEVKNTINNGQLTDSTESGVSSPSPSELGNKSEPEDNEKTKLELRHSLPNQQIVNNRRGIKRTASVPPPPPPPPSEETSLTSLPLEHTQTVTAPHLPLPQVPDQVDNAAHAVHLNNDTPQTENECKPNATTKSATVQDAVQPAAVLPHQQPMFQQQCHTNSTSTQVGHLVNKQMVLPFIPPKFGGGHDPDALIKPSEYLKSLQCANNLNNERNIDNEININNTEDTNNRNTEMERLNGGGDTVVTSVSQANSGGNENGDIIVEEDDEVEGRQGVPLPPPPPPPPPPHQPLSTISIQDITSVQLKRTKQPATKTMSCPHPSLTGSVESPFLAAKEDLIAELKMSKDISGIKKLKVERVKQEEKHGKEIASTISKQFSVDYFVDKMPDKDASGNPIPAWKRQMLAKKAADKARKEMEDELAKEAEAKRLQAIPAWKRHLLQKKQSEDHLAVSTNNNNNINNNSSVKNLQNGFQNGILHQHHTNNNNNNNNHNNNNNNQNGILTPTSPQFEIKKNKENSQQNNDTKESIVRVDNEDDSTPIIPWRAQLRKTNSTLNLLE